MTELLKKGVREDDRKPYDYRKIEVEVNPIFKANGSAIVRIGNSEITEADWDIYYWSEDNGFWWYGSKVVDADEFTEIDERRIIRGA